MEHLPNTLSSVGHLHVSKRDRILDRLSPTAQVHDDTKSRADILTKLSEQQRLLEEQQISLVHCNSAPVNGPDTNKPGGDSFPSLPISGAVQSDPKAIEASELLRLKRELDAANSKIAHQEEELTQTRVIKHTLDQALGPPIEPEFDSHDIPDQTIGNLQFAFNESPFNHDPWDPQIDSQPDISDRLSAGSYNSARALWTPSSQPATTILPIIDKPHAEPFSLTESVSQEPSRLWAGGPIHDPSHGSSHPSQLLPGLVPGSCSLDHSLFQAEQSGFGPKHQAPEVGRFGLYNFPTRNLSWGGLAATGSSGRSVPKSTRRSSALQPQVGIYPTLPYHPRHFSTPLSPTASEFTSADACVTPWGNPSSVSHLEKSFNVPHSHSQFYVNAPQLQASSPPFEPINYRRLLDKNVSCDWKYIVDKIVYNNDQQASIFLQQKLKVGTSEQKHDIIEAIVQLAYALMVNRFGNFLVQRCFEYGTRDQIVDIANAIRGRTLDLSMDAFGCHVVQKAFDCVPEEYKAFMVHEMLRRVPETVVHRYACHVWQKLFELRWSSEPPQIMEKVNEALRGLWHNVACGETGSLVVQNIFENCMEEDKVKFRRRPLRP